MPGSSRIAAMIPYICMPGTPYMTSTPSLMSDLTRASPPLILTMLYRLPTRYRRNQKGMCTLNT